MHQNVPAKVPQFMSIHQKMRVVYRWPDGSRSVLTGSFFFFFVWLLQSQQLLLVKCRINHSVRIEQLIVDNSFRDGYPGFATIYWLSPRLYYEFLVIIVVFDSIFFSCYHSLQKLLDFILSFQQRIADVNLVHSILHRQFMHYSNIELLWWAWWICSIISLPF